jgi:hypothetical protein
VKREREEDERWRQEGVGKTARVRFWVLLLSRRGAAHRAEEARIMR